VSYIGTSLRYVFKPIFYYHRDYMYSLRLYFLPFLLRAIFDHCSDYFRGVAKDIREISHACDTNSVTGLLELSLAEIFPRNKPDVYISSR
jgi:hypothetical protein